MRTLIVLAALAAVAAVACGGAPGRQERMMATAQAVWTATARSAPTATARAEATATATKEEAAALLADVVMEGRWRGLAAESLRLALDAMDDHRRYGTGLLQACEALGLVPQESWRPRLPELAAIYDELVALTERCYWTLAQEGPAADRQLKELASDTRALLLSIGQDQ